MKASELIEQLQTLVKDHGDFSIGIRDHVEGNDWAAESVVVEKQKSYGMAMNTATGKYDIQLIDDTFVIE